MVQHLLNYADSFFGGCTCTLTQTHMYSSMYSTCAHTRGLKNTYKIISIFVFIVLVGLLVLERLVNPLTKALTSHSGRPEAFGSLSGDLTQRLREASLCRSQ